MEILVLKILNAHLILMHSQCQIQMNVVICVNHVMQDVANVQVQIIINVHHAIQDLSYIILFVNQAVQLDFSKLMSQIQVQMAAL